MKYVNFITSIKDLNDQEARFLSQRYKSLEYEYNSELGFQIELFHDERVKTTVAWLFADGPGNLDRLLELVDPFFQRFRPTVEWGFSYSFTLMRSEIEEDIERHCHGGGAVFIIGAERRVVDTDAWLRQQFTQKADG